MKVGFIGAGKVGCTLGRYLVMHGMNVIGYYDVNLQAADYAVNILNKDKQMLLDNNMSNVEKDNKASFQTNANIVCKRYLTIKEIVDESDCLFITVTDANISKVWEEIYHHIKEESGLINDSRRISEDKSKKERVICHCSGSLSSKVFSGIDTCGAYGYSIHPLFACSSKEESYKDISNAIFTIEGDKKYIGNIKQMLSEFGNKVKIISDKDKALYHAAAVVTSNQVVALHQMAINMLQRCGFDENEAATALLPLLMGNVSNIAKQGVTDALTGPVERNDLETVNKHLKALQSQEKQVYTHLSSILVDIAKKKNKDTDYSQLLDCITQNIERTDC